MSLATSSSVRVSTLLVWICYAPVVSVQWPYRSCFNEKISTTECTRQRQRTDCAHWLKSLICGVLKVLQGHTYWTFISGGESQGHTKVGRPTAFTRLVFGLGDLPFKRPDTLCHPDQTEDRNITCIDQIVNSHWYVLDILKPEQQLLVFRMLVQAEILNVSTITISGCVKIFLFGVNFLFQTYSVLS